MDVIEMIRYLNSQDGPRMPLRALSPYLGTDTAQLSLYLNGKSHPKEETRRRMEKGMTELVREINKQWPI